ncbi:MAG TPA: nucleotide sugar dehydrogenase [Candidatus Saccharimonadales bacterium]|nr:nucleotide sugar dehydrogenase [Candidatus Saccharimonadales bacterium]
MSGAYRRQRGAVPRTNGDGHCPQWIRTSATSAELIKHASNAFLAMKISFINAVANLCERTGADIEEVTHGIGADTRIGPKFFRAGLGYGGSCFPKDVSAFRTLAKELGHELPLLDEVVRINEQQRKLFVAKVRAALGNLRGMQVAALGLAFKGGTDDIRESPALAVVESLLAEGCGVAAFDPAAMQRVQAGIRRANLSYAADPYDAAKSADALLILTDWEQFANLDLKRIKLQLRRPLIVDGRNLYRAEEMSLHGLEYHSIGRPAAIPEYSIASDAFRHEERPDAARIPRRPRRTTPVLASSQSS